MPDVSFSGLLIVAIVAFLAPLLLALTPARRLPEIVLEIVAGIIIGPSVLGWVKIDLPISILSVLGLAFLLFLAGLEVELERLRGRLLAFVGSAFLFSFGLALLVGYGLYLAGQVISPLLIAIILVATGLGIVIPVLKDAGESATDFGQLVIAGAMFAEFGSIILLTLFFSREASGITTTLVLLAGFVLLVAGFAFVVLRLERSKRIAAVMLRLQDTTAQIRIRGAFMLLVAFVALASVLGLETILGAFIAGVILRLVDGDRLLTHPQFRQKLEAIGFGVFIPVFFVTSGIRFDLAALFSSPSTIVRVPIFLAALLFVRECQLFFTVHS
jgi:Kef-type K+ transport system membrane component KefB